MNTSLAAQPSRRAPGVTTVAGYLLIRLAEAGLRSVFGVPGEDNLALLDAVTDRPSLAWLGTATEQGAGHAAGSYARLRGLGALVTTFGAGELSALNAIAGAYAESVPVVHIVGTPALAARESGTTLRHQLPGRDFGHFARMAAEVTAAQADLRPETAPAEIDRVLSIALRTSRPVYLAVPADVAAAPVLAPAGRLPLAARDAYADPAVLAAFARHAREVLGAAASASLLAGHLAARHRVTARVRDLAVAGDLPVAVLSTAKGDFPESDPRFAGLYAGAASAKRTRVAVEDTDVLITVGVVLADTVTGGTHQLPGTRRIDLAPGQATIGDTVYPGVGLAVALAVLTAAVRQAPLPPRASRAGQPEPAPELARTGRARTGHALTQQTLWASLQRFLLPDDLVVADQGTAFYGAAGLTLPPRAQLIGQPLWASPGWALPAALGASLAAPDRRLILVIGDGAMQQAAPELGTLLALGLAPVIIVVNNGGHTTERTIHRPAAAYHDIPAWDWTALPGTLGRAVSPLGIRAASSRQLTAALSSACRHAGRPVLIEAVLGPDDAPPLLQDLARMPAVSDEYARP